MMKLIAIGNPIKRAVVRRLHKAVIGHPQSAKTLLDKFAGKKGFELVGMGVDAIVYKDGADFVRKLHLGTIDLTNEQRKIQLAERLSELQILRNFLGQITLDQTMWVGQHPIVARPMDLIQDRQAYCDYDREVEFTKVNQAEVPTAQVEAAVRKYPGVDTAVLDMIQWARIMHEETGYLPDTNGTHNLVVGSVNGQLPELHLIDGKPVGPEHPNVQLTITDQLNSLASAVMAAA